MTSPVSAPVTWVTEAHEFGHSRGPAMGPNSPTRPSLECPKGTVPGDLPACPASRGRAYQLRWERVRYAGACTASGRLRMALNTDSRAPPARSRLWAGVRLRNRPAGAFDRQSSCR